MLYDLHEMQRALLNPLSAWAEANARLYSNPASPLAYTPVSRRLAASFELLYRLGKTYEKPEWHIESTTVDGREVPIDIDVEIYKPFCKLIHFHRRIDAARNAKDPRVIVFAPLSGHHATLLRDTVRTLVKDHDVWVTDWIDARMVPLSSGDFNLDDYVEYVQEFVRHLGPNVHLISVCQPTVPVLAGVSLMASRKEKHLPRSMTMMGGPIDTRVGQTEVNALAQRKPYSWFETNVVYSVPAQYPGYLRKVYPGFLQHAGFIAMNPDRHAQSHYDFYLDLVKGDLEDAESHRRFYDEYNAVLDLPAEYYLQTIKVVFQDHLLPKGEWMVRDELVRPQDIKSVALLTVEGELDDISGPGQTQAAHRLCSSIPKNRQFDYIVEGAGHYGIFSGRRWRDSVYPRIRDFIRQFDQSTR
ncbi:MAG TPA: polyhydroxyalkanoate depolymerase [Burkholderiaceae bacterium]|nr:polyhydroxyalkanoate depolymerase [Burkholderiaceae bacterium]